MPIIVDGFKIIEIKDFRGTDHLIIGVYSRANAFFGQNYSGKGSVLKANRNFENTQH